MAYVCHQAIVVTTSDHELNLLARKQARKCGLKVSSTMKDGIFFTFLVSNQMRISVMNDNHVPGRKSRGDFVAWLRAEPHIHYVNVQYADDDGNTRINGSSDHDSRAKRERQTANT